MKKISISIILILLIICNIQGQLTGTKGRLIFEETLDLQPQSSWIDIPDSINNIWDTGSPGKTYFDSGYDDTTAILTDLKNYYRNNCNDYFSIKIPLNENYWGEGILSFYHNFDTDTLRDGGIIEISYDNGISWINIKDDVYHIDYHYIGLYADTISGGEYGFSGKSEGWQYVELYWYWRALARKKSIPEDPDYSPILRFRFISDDNNTSKEGWMIDNIIFRGYDLTGMVKSPDYNKIQIYPNPASEYIAFKSMNNSKEGFSLILFDTNGRMIKYMDIADEKISIKDMNPGIYIYRLQQGNNIQVGQFVKIQE